MMINVFFLVILASVILLISLFTQLRRKIRYFLANTKNKINGIVASVIDRGIICLLFGLAHRLLIRQPNIQLFALFTLELVWVISRSIFLKKLTYESKFLAFIWILEGLMRMAFIASFYIYDNY